MMNGKTLRSKILTISLITLACHPVMIAILSPYMLLVVGLTFNQLVLWWWTGLFIGMGLNAALTVYIGWIAPKIGKVVDKVVK